MAEEAFAKLIGRIGPSNDDETTKREFLITKLPCILGRAILDDGNHSIVVDPDDTLLSRQHVQISWTQASGWSLLCLSKNGCTVNKQKYGKSDVASLSNGSPIRIGNARFYFTLPVENNKKRTHSETFAGTDEEEGDLIMGMPGTTSLSSKLIANNNSR
jgi:pSer/pThr/pTyr-binding forkhead associated (FHA) protein